MRASSWPSSRHCTSKGTRSSLSCTRTWGCCAARSASTRSEEHTSELQSQSNLVCRLLLEKKKISSHLKQNLHNLPCSFDQCSPYHCRSICTLVQIGLILCLPYPATRVSRRHRTHPYSLYR